MTDRPIRSGRTSGFGHTTQPSAGAFVTPADIIKTTSFDFTENPQTEFFETLNLTLDAESEARNGVHKVGGKASFPLRTIQGIPLLKGGIGSATASGATAFAFGSLTAAAYPAGTVQFTMQAAPGAPPAGYGEWTLAPLVIGTGGTQETVAILGVNGAVVNTTASKFAHNGDVCSVPINTAFNPLVGANADQLDLFSLVAQYGHAAEIQLYDCHVSGVSINGDDTKLMTEVQFVSDQQLTDTTSLTTLESVGGASEQQDVPFMQRDGGLITPWSPTDLVPTMHSRLKSLKLDLSFAMQAEKVGGGIQVVELNAYGKRSIKLTWSELAGQNGYQSQIYNNYVKDENEMPVFLWYRNQMNGNIIGFWFPRCRVAKYDRVGPDDKPISYDGEIHVLPDYTSGKVMKMMVMNGVTY